MLMEKIAHFTNLPEDLVQIASLQDVQLNVANVVIGGHNISTVDVRLKPFKEDKLYENQLYHTLIPRGCCFVFVNNNFVHALYGHPKFGNFGDYVNTDIEYYSNSVFRRKRKRRMFTLVWI